MLLSWIRSSSIKQTLGFFEAFFLTLRTVSIILSEQCLCAQSQCRWMYFLFQNEEALKKCAQDYLTRVKQEEQRYQALKIHAEEKLDK